MEYKVIAEEGITVGDNSFPCDATVVLTEDQAAEQGDKVAAAAVTVESGTSSETVPGRPQPGQSA